MITQQLNLFPGMETQIVTTYRKTKQMYVIWLQATTKRAAAMLDVAESTLCNAKRRGQTIYRKDDMEARYVGKSKKSFLWMIIQYR